MQRRIMILMLIFIAGMIVNVHAQKKLWELKAFQHQPFSDVVLDSLASDTLYFSSSNIPKELDISLLIDLQWDGESNTGTGILIGVLGGGLIGSQLAPDIENSNSNPISAAADASVKISYTILGALGGGAIGLIVGANTYETEYYNFQKIPIEAKRTILTKLIQN
jgi:hypothetical protein